jgi:cellulose synthase/poly-beta-1,6-N-acetylglucosamine synthase-like glycosyltransferase
MMILLLWICLLLYLLSVCGLVLHSVFFIPLFLRYLKNRNTPLISRDRFADTDLPFHIIQLPVYNEDVDMVKQLVTSATKQVYPHERLLIQLLDDSDRQIISDELKQLVMEINEHDPSIPLIYYHRSNREDYKAGNLNFGLQKAIQKILGPGEFHPDNTVVSVFDADFIIPPNYIEETVHYFTSMEVGAVQAAYDYYNQNINYLTMAQASYLVNLHNIEFKTRSWEGHLTIYRGSAGSWRLSTIQKSGGWQGDTQVEDVDLSIAAQLRGWKILYLDHISASCQLPHGYNEFKLQQRSWVKGLMEVFRKRVGSILVSRKLSPSQKLLGIDFFLILTFQPLFMIAGHLFLIPSYYLLKMHDMADLPQWITLGLLLLLSTTHLSFLSTGAKQATLTGVFRRAAFVKKFSSIWLIPSLFTALTFGLIEGLIGIRVHRDKTSKVSPSIDTSHPRLSDNQKRLLRRIGLCELFMCIFSISFIGWAVWSNQVLIALIYGILAICYPWGMLLSYIDYQNT